MLKATHGVAFCIYITPKSITQKSSYPKITALAWWTMTGSNCRHPACKAGALPAELIVHIGDPSGNRTRDTAVKGRCLNRLTNGPEMVTHPRLERGTP